MCFLCWSKSRQVPILVSVLGGLGPDFTQCLASTSANCEPGCGVSVYPFFHFAFCHPAMLTNSPSCFFLSFLYMSLPFFPHIFMRSEDYLSKSIILIKVHLAQAHAFPLPAATGFCPQIPPFSKSNTKIGLFFFGLRIALSDGQNSPLWLLSLCLWRLHFRKMTDKTTRCVPSTPLFPKPPVWTQRAVSMTFLLVWVGPHHVSINAMP